MESIKHVLGHIGIQPPGLVVAFDFTQSNLRTGQHSFGGKCLHEVGAVLNPYQHALTVIGRNIPQSTPNCDVDSFGFGDATAGGCSVFSFYADNEPCRGLLTDVLPRYVELVPRIKLSGPTAFSPIIYQAIHVVKRSMRITASPVAGSQQQKAKPHILLLLTDGTASEQNQNTENAIIAASHYPLSIIMVGVGDGPWDAMGASEQSLPQRVFDNFHFVNFTALMSQQHASREELEDAIAKEALRKFPAQVIEMKRLGLLSGGGQPHPSPSVPTVVVLDPPPRQEQVVPPLPGSPVPSHPPNPVVLCTAPRQANPGQGSPWQPPGPGPAPSLPSTAWIPPPPIPHSPPRCGAPHAAPLPRTPPRQASTPPPYADRGLPSPATPPRDVHNKPAHIPAGPPRYAVSPDLQTRATGTRDQAVHDPWAQGARPELPRPPQGLSTPPRSPVPTSMPVHAAELHAGAHSRAAPHSPMPTAPLPSLPGGPGTAHWVTRAATPDLHDPVGAPSQLHRPLSGHSTPVVCSRACTPPPAHMQEPSPQRPYPASPEQPSAPPLPAALYPTSMFPDPGRLPAAYCAMGPVGLPMPLPSDPYQALPSDPCVPRPPTSPVPTAPLPPPPRTARRSSEHGGMAPHMSSPQALRTPSHALWAGAELSSLHDSGASLPSHVCIDTAPLQALHLHASASPYAASPYDSGASLPPYVCMDTAPLQALHPRASASPYAASPYDSGASLPSYVCTDPVAYAPGAQLYLQASAPPNAACPCEPGMSLVPSWNVPAPRADTPQLAAFLQPEVASAQAPPPYDPTTSYVPSWTQTTNIASASPQLLHLLQPAAPASPYHSGSYAVPPCGTLSAGGDSKLPRHAGARAHAPSEPPVAASPYHSGSYAVPPCDTRCSGGDSTPPRPSGAHTHAPPQPQPAAAVFSPHDSGSSLVSSWAAVAPRTVDPRPQPDPLQLPTWSPPAQSLTPPGPPHPPAPTWPPPAPAVTPSGPLSDLPAPPGAGTQLQAPPWLAATQSPPPAGGLSHLQAPPLTQSLPPPGAGSHVQAVPRPAAAQSPPPPGILSHLQASPLAQSLPLVGAMSHVQAAPRPASAQSPPPPGVLSHLQAPPLAQSLPLASAVSHVPAVPRPAAAQSSPPPGVLSHLQAPPRLDPAQSPSPPGVASHLLQAPALAASPLLPPPVHPELHMQAPVLPAPPLLSPPARPELLMQALALPAPPLPPPAARPELLMQAPALPASVQPPSLEGPVLRAAQQPASGPGTTATAAPLGLPGRPAEEPPLFICPITQECMKDPVTAADGFNYEKSAIESWYKHHNTSPMTNDPVESKMLFPNYGIRSAIMEAGQRGQTQETLAP